MKFSVTKNDTSTYWDEVILTILTLLLLAGGILLLVFRPSFWIITEGVSISIGVIALIVSFMYAPCIMYRFFHNDNVKKK